jgi:hypothetical protein
MLTLYTTPVIYLYLDRLQIRLRSRKYNRFRVGALSDSPAGD